MTSPGPALPDLDAVVLWSSHPEQQRVVNPGDPSVCESRNDDEEYYEYFEQE